jgi:hypothetical protein
MTQSLLTVPASEATRQIDERIRIGEEMQRRLPDRGEPSLAQLEVDEQIWTESNISMLRGLFSSDEIVREFERRTPPLTQYAGEPGLRVRWEDEIRRVRMRVATLRQIRGRVAQLAMAVATGDPGPLEPARSVLVLHRNDAISTGMICEWLQSIGLRAQVLRQAGRSADGQSQPALSAGFALVLVSAEEEGRRLGSGDDLQHRAHQDVLVQLGLLAGRLGAGRVCVLYRMPLTVAGQDSGLTWVPLDVAGAWKKRLLPLFSAAGLQLPDAGGADGAPGRS